MVRRFGLGVSGLLVAAGLLVGMSGVASAASGGGTVSVGTGYAHEGVEDLIWGAEHMGYSDPAELQKTGVLVIRFILVALSGVTEPECNLNLGAALDPYGPHRWVSAWSAEEIEALEWVADHYCISEAQAQAFGGTLMAFFAGLDAAANGTSAVRRDPPPDPSEQTIPGRPSGLVATAGNGQVALSWTAPASGASSYTVTYYDPALATVLPAAQRAFWKVPPGVVEPHIVGGGKVSNSDHPYQVALLTATDSSGFTAQFCSGTLVAPRWVVTAAHCVANKTAAGVDVGVGKDDLSLIGASDRHVVSAIHVHPSYDSATYANDIALLQLSTAVTSSTAKWIPWQTDTTEPAAGTTGTVSGWGTVTLDESIYRNDLQGATVKVLESPGDDLCGAWDNYSATEKLCVGGERNVGACTGDSGGPLAINLGYTHLVGIASYGADDECADVTYPNVMTRVSNYDAWLQSHIGNPWVETTPTTTSTTVTGLANGTDYTFYVTAINADGNSSYAISAAATPYTIPGAPTGLTATQGVAEVALSWTAPASDGGAALTDYTVEYSSDSGSTWTTFTDGTSTTASTTVTGLSHSTTYTFRVSAVNAAGTGTASDTASVATATTAGAPTGLSATQGVAEVALSWTAPASDGGAALTDYTVEYSSDSGSTWATFSDGSSTTASVTVTGLDGGTSYLFRVSAVNAAGAGTASGTVAATFRGLTGRKVEFGIANTSTGEQSPGPSAQVGIAVGSDGNAVIVFAEASKSISSVWCGTATCADLTDASTNTLFAYLDNEGLDPAIAVPDDGYPVVAFRDLPESGAEPASLSLVFCDNGYVEGAFDSSCSSSTTVVVDAAGDPAEANTDYKGRDPSIAIGNDGYPVVSYFVGTNATTGELRIAVCTSANCGTSEITTIANVEPGHRSSSVVIGSDGNPLVAYRDSGDVKMVVCANTSCTSSSTTTLGPLFPVAGSQVAMATRTGTHPIVAYDGDEPLATFGLDVTACTNADCSTGTQNEAIDQANVNINGGLAIATDSNGLPVIAFINNSALNLYECSASDCSSGNRLVIDEGSLFGGVNGGRTGDGDYTPSGEVAISLTSDDTRLIAYGVSVNAGGDSLYLAVVDGP